MGVQKGRSSCGYYNLGVCTLAGNLLMMPSFLRVRHSAYLRRLTSAPHQEHFQPTETQSCELENHTEDPDQYVRALEKLNQIYALTWNDVMFVNNDQTVTFLERGKMLDLAERKMLLRS